MKQRVDVEEITFFPWKAYDKLIIEAAEGALTVKDLPSKEREVIELGLRHLRDGLARLNPEDWEAAWLMMVGTLFVTSRVMVSDAVTKFLNKRHGTWRNKDAIKRIDDKIKWQAHVRQRVSEMYDKDLSVKGTTIAHSIKNKSAPPGVSLPAYREVYEFVLVELKALKQGGG